MKVIKNNFFRLFLLLLGYIGIVMLFVGTFIGYATYYYVGSDNVNEPYAQSEFIRNRVSDGALRIMDEAKLKKEKDDLGLNEKTVSVVTLKNYSVDQENEFTFDKLLETDDVALKLYDEVISMSSSYYSFDYEYRYRDIPSNESGKIIKVRLKDFLNSFKNKGYKYYGESEKDGEEVSNIVENLTENGFDFSAEGNVYYIKAGDSYIFYNETNNYLYRTGFLFPEGHQNLDAISGEYVYFAYNDYKEYDDLVNGYMYCTLEEALFATLTPQERTAIENISTHEVTYMNGVNTLYSFGNDAITNCNIEDEKIGETLYQSSDKSYNSTYSKVFDQLSKRSDVFVSYDSKSGKLTQWYINDKNKSKVEYDYLTKRDILALTEDGGVDFAIGLRLYDNPYYSFERSIYNFCLNVKYPALITVIGVIFFLLALVLLTVGAPAKLNSFDKVPYIVHWALLSLVALCIAAVATTMDNFSNRFAEIYVNEPVGFIAFIIVMAAVVYIVCALVYLSLIRRIKCRKFFEGFITILVFKWLIRKLVKSSRLLKGKTRLIASIIAFLFVTFIISMIVMATSRSGAAVFGSMLILLIDLIAAGFVIRYMVDIERLIYVSKQIESGDLQAKIDTEKLSFNNRELGNSLNNLGTGLSRAVEASVRDERTKAELITNVSHDIKTPLTSIINYVDLLKREDIDNEKAKEYIDVLDKKSDRLKQLILDLIEASKTSTGNIELEKTNMNLIMLVEQAVGEYEDKFREKNLDLVQNISIDRAVINADGRRIFRVIDNVFGNVYKYSLEGTRVYLNLGLAGDRKNVILSIKNVSREMLNISAQELTERFVRGDKSRSTEGSGLGLSIAKNLVEMHNGNFKINIDGDLFTVIISLPLAQSEISENA